MYDIENILNNYNPNISFDLIYIDTCCSGYLTYKGYKIGKFSNTEDIGYKYESLVTEYIVYDVKDSMHPLKYNYREPGAFIYDMLRLLDKDIQIIERELNKLSNKNKFLEEVIRLMNNYNLALKVGLNGDLVVASKTEEDINNIKSLITN